MGRPFSSKSLIPQRQVYGQSRALTKVNPPGNFRILTGVTWPQATVGGQACSSLFLPVAFEPHAEPDDGSDGQRCPGNFASDTKSDVLSCPAAMHEMHLIPRCNAYAAL